MIYKGDIIRLFNPSEGGLRKYAHMHIVESVIDKGTGCKRKLAVCTTNPMRYIKKGVPFLEIRESPFVYDENDENTYIRLDPMYLIKNVKIKTESRICPEFKLKADTESTFFERVNQANEEELNRDEFIKMNPRYAIDTEK